MLDHEIKAEWEIESNEYWQKLRDGVDVRTQSERNDCAPKSSDRLRCVGK